MPIYAIYKRESDTCGNENITGPFKYIKADNIKDVEEVYPKGFFIGNLIEEIQIEELPIKGSLASGVSEKGRQMYSMYEKRFGKSS